MSRRINPAYWFLAPALSAIIIFFFVPVAASVVLSLTDFDIYAVASRADLGSIVFEPEALTGARP